LHPEEALFLAKKELLTLKDGDNTLNISEFYCVVIRVVGLPCYLAYAKLKVSMSYMHFTTMFHWNHV
jgi:hypothetical protein